jgi:hypothetical protein
MASRRRSRYIRQVRYISFGLGAALGSALGLVLGTVLTFWVGEGTLRAIQRGVRRLAGGDDHPNFEVLAQ